MNFTFLIGNGFDINCGLKSSYSDMYEGYCEEKETDSEVIKKFKKLIKQNNYKNWSDFEWAMREYINEFKIERDFIECLEDFGIYLNNYLIEEEAKFFKRYQSNKFLISELQNEIKKSINIGIGTSYEYFSNNVVNDINDKKRNSLMPIQYNFIVFNYTEVFERMLGLARVDNHVVYIHGSLKGKDIILGIDNEKQLELKIFKLSDVGKLSFIKPIFNEEYDTSRVNVASNTILESDVICVYGMSLGESDLTWKTLIVNWLDLMDGHLFVYDYENFNNKNIFLKSQQMREEFVSKENFLIKKLKIDKSNDKFDKYFKKIHMPFKNIFNIKETIDNYETKNEF